MARDELPNIEGLEKVVYDCCWSYTKSGVEVVICPTLTIKCKAEKLTMLRGAYLACQKVHKLIEESASKIVEITMLDEPYDFGLKRNNLYHKIEVGKFVP